MKLIAGIPADVLDEHKSKVLEMKRQGFELALSVARMPEEERKITGFKNADEVILMTAKDIERITVALERKYPA
jgi:hypothetical protein